MVLVVCNFTSTLLRSTVGGGFKWECYTSLALMGLASGWASQDSLPDCKVVGRVVAHVPYPKTFEAVPVHPKDVIAS